jgi:sporulation protein YlmC with PRC-barrel domain
MDTKRIQGLQVITLAGVKVGTVDQIFVDPTTKHVTGFGLLDNSILPDDAPLAFFDAADVHALGADALTLPDTTAVRGTVTAAHRDTLIDVANLTKCQVVTEGGTLVGQIAAVDLDPRTLQLTRIEVSPGFFKSNKWIEAEHVTRLGADAIMVVDAVAVPEAAMPPMETTGGAEATV